MIKSLQIQNFILIDELKLEFDKGFNIFTGETGAGKSIIINSIDIALGSKVSLDVIKSGKEKAVIELIVELPESLDRAFLSDNGIDVFNNELIISREILPTTTRSRINGVVVTQDFIKELKEQIIDIHSQHQTYTYIQPKYHIRLLDNFGDDSHQLLLNEYKQQYKSHNQILKELELARDAGNVTEQQIEFLKFQIDEIESSNIVDLEEIEKLKSELEVLVNTEKLKELTYSGYYNLYEDENNILSGLALIKSNISKALSYDQSLGEVEELFINACENLKEVSYQLKNYYEKLDNDEQRLDEIQIRLDLLDKLRRKYGNTLEDVLKSLEGFRSEYEKIEYSNQNVIELEERLKSSTLILEELGKKLSNSRKQLSEKLSVLIQDELEQLEMPKAVFKIDVSEKSFNEFGTDDVEFLISTNVSESLKPLARVASGGEISRVMLAIKTIFAKSDNVGTIIFDEIDSGISGKASQAVADAISELSKYHQVISITHQPIVAAKANRHFYVNKSQSDTTKVNVHTLQGENIVKSIAMLAGGEINDESMMFAKKLLGVE